MAKRLRDFLKSKETPKNKTILKRWSRHADSANYNVPVKINKDEEKTLTHVLKRLKKR